LDIVDELFSCVFGLTVASVSCKLDISTNMDVCLVYLAIYFAGHVITQLIKVSAIYAWKWRYIWFNNVAAIRREIKKFAASLS